ncbi:MAG: preprotein translocase subunit SecE [Neisseriaceae bacterium]|nr:preprotein translocase subunit SecE [Neisseriaceae bacterium]
MSKNKKSEVSTETKNKPSKTEIRQREQEERQRNSTMDKVKLTLAIILAGAGVFAYHFFDKQLPIFVRTIFPIVGVTLAVVLVFFFCSFGKNLIAYIRESTKEMGKVVWPEKKSAMQMTLTVIVFAALLALFMAMSDGLVSWILFDILLKRG